MKRKGKFASLLLVLHMQHASARSVNMYNNIADKCLFCYTSMEMGATCKFNWTDWSTHLVAMNALSGDVARDGMRKMCGCHLHWDCEQWGCCYAWEYCWLTQCASKVSMCVYVCVCDIMFVAISVDNHFLIKFVSERNAPKTKKLLRQKVWMRK